MTCYGRAFLGNITLPLFAVVVVCAGGTSWATPDERREPFAFADFTWLPGNAGASERPLAFGPFVGELRLDTAYHYSFAHPKDDTISGSSEVFRHGELQVTHVGV